MSRSIRSYQAEITRLRGWLIDLQWVQPMYNGSPSCSGCGEQKHLHDDAKCGLSQEIARRKSVLRRTVARKVAAR